MKIFAEQLNGHLQKNLMQVYLLYGNEPLLLQESRLSIKKAAYTHDFTQKISFSVDGNTNWDDIFNSALSQGLFATKQIIELDFLASSISTTHARELIKLQSLLHPDLMLVIITNTFTKTQENSAWFKVFKQSTSIVSCLTPEKYNLEKFIHARCRSLDLKPEQSAVQMLANWFEGNLLALVQNLEKFALIYPDLVITVARLEEVLIRQNHFTSFQWIDALLAGKANRTQRILKSLISEDIQPNILIRMLQKELLLLLEMHHLLINLPMTKVFDKYNIWQNKRPLYQAALNRLTVANLHKILQLLAQTELIMKNSFNDPNFNQSIFNESIWLSIKQLSLVFCFTK